MKKHILYYFWLLAPIALWAQTQDAVDTEIDLSDVIVVSDISQPAESEPEAAEVAEAPDVDIAGLDQSAPVVDDAVTAQTSTTSDIDVVEIPATPIEGASFDMEAPKIPVVTTSLPTDTEIVLELPGQGTSVPGEASLASEETISVDFPDEDVRTILRNVADLFELNLVIPDTLQGRTSIKLRNITWRQAFEVVLEPLGYTHVEDRNIIRIKSIEELTSEPADTRVFVANYARAQELQGAIAPLIDAAAGGRIQVDVRSNALVITERPSRMNKIQEIIERLDKATDQVMIESKFIEVTNNDIKNIGVNWASLNGYDLTAGPFQRVWERTRESGSDNTTTQGVGTQTARDTSSGAIDGNPSAVPAVENTTGSVNSTFDQLSAITSSASTGRFDTAVFSAAQFSVILSALKTDNNSKLVANPTVVTMNNQPAKISIVTEIPQVEFTFNAETGTREADGLADPLIFGTEIEVTPQVNAAGFINLNLVPSVSNQIGLIDTQVGPQPIISRREANTNVVIKDGFTLAIGGLSQNEETKSGSKVPVLGSLPGIGRFFRSESNDVEQRNLIIFITAKTLNPDGSSYRDIVDPRVLNDMGVIPSDVPGYELPQADLEALSRLETIRAEAHRNERIGEVRSQIEAATEALQSESNE